MRMGNVVTFLFYGVYSGNNINWKLTIRPRIAFPFIPTPFSGLNKAFINFVITYHPIHEQNSFVLYLTLTADNKYSGL